MTGIYQRLPATKFAKISDLANCYFTPGSMAPVSNLVCRPPSDHTILWSDRSGQTMSGRTMNSNLV